MRSASSGPPAPRLAGIRSRWLAAVTASLDIDPAVAGLGLAGSLGAGRADDWSDVDLILVVDDARLDEYARPERLPAGPGTLIIAFDSRHNGLRGTRVVSAQYLIDGLPLWADWYIYPRSLAAWPADSTPVLDRPGIPRLTATFTEHLAAEHEPPAPRSPAERRTLQLALVPIAGKMIARRSPKTIQMIEILGGSSTPGATWADHLATLRQLLRDLTPAGPPPSATAARTYLTLVEAALLSSNP
jgi:hypothetical protein